MAEKIWVVQKSKYCEYVGHEILIENELILPAEHLPEQPPHITARRCSSALECNMIEHPVCALCGTNPNLDIV